MTAKTKTATARTAKKATAKRTATVSLSKVALSAVAKSFKAAGTSATPIGSTGSGAKPFKLGTKTFASMLDLAQRDPATFAKVTAADLRKGGASAPRAGALMAHRTRILNAAGIGRQN